MNDNTSRYIGEIYKSEKYGDIEVVGGKYAKALVVRFANTGFVTTTKRSHLASGSVKDKLYVPSEFSSGSIFSTPSGDVEVIDYANSLDVTVRFVGTGFIKRARAETVRTGNIMDPFFRSVYGIGFLGDSEPFSTPFRKKARKCWHHMMSRCYSKRYQELKPTYVGCTVDSEWHCMANFMAWFEDNYPNDGKQYHLDKDIKINSNKVYSKDACLFVSPEENSMAMNGTLNSIFVLYHREHGEVHVNNLSAHARKHSVNASGFSYIVNRKKKSYKGWFFIRRYETN